MDCEASASFLLKRSTGLQRVVGTMKVHAVYALPDSTSEILVRDLSCSCHNCLEDPQISPCGWTKHTLCTNGDNSNFRSPPIMTDAHVGDWVAAMYELEWFIGRVTKISEDGITIDFLTQTGRLMTDYHQPLRKDIFAVPHEDIIGKIDDPTSRRGYKINSETVDRLQSLASQWIERDTV